MDKRDSWRGSRSRRGRLPTDDDAQRAAAKRWRARTQKNLAPRRQQRRRSGRRTIDGGGKEGGGRREEGAFGVFFVGVAALSCFCGGCFFLKCDEQEAACFAFWGWGTEKQEKQPYHHPTNGQSRAKSWKAENVGLAGTEPIQPPERLDGGSARQETAEARVSAAQRTQPDKQHNGGERERERERQETRRWGGGRRERGKEEREGGRQRGEKGGPRKGPRPRAPLLLCAAAASPLFQKKTDTVARAQSFALSALAGVSPPPPPPCCSLLGGAARSLPLLALLCSSKAQKQKRERKRREEPPGPVIIIITISSSCQLPLPQKAEAPLPALPQSRSSSSSSRRRTGR